MGVVLLRGQRQRLQPQQGTVLIIQGTRLQVKLPGALHSPALVEQRQRRVGP